MVTNWRESPALRAVLSPPLGSLDLQHSVCASELIEGSRHQICRPRAFA